MCTGIKTHQEQWPPTRGHVPVPPPGLLKVQNLRNLQNFLNFQKKLKGLKVLNILKCLDFQTFQHPRHRGGGRRSSKDCADFKNVDK